MKSLSQASQFPYGIIMAVGALVFLFFAVITAATVYASPKEPANGERLITIHDNGKDKGILTRATTLREVFEEAGIPTDQNDRIEPGLDETLVASSYEVNVYRARPITIVDGKVQTKVMSAYRTPKQIVEQADMVLQDEDETAMEVPGDMVQHGAGMRLVIDRATPFTLVLYGKKTTAFTQESTVGEMLEKKGVKLAAQDTLSVPATTSIKAGMTVELWRNGKQTINEEQEVPFEIEKIQDANREVGFREVKTPGVKGQKTVTYEVVMKNGVESERKEIQSVVTKEPKKEVVIVGTKMTNSFSGSFAEALARLRSCEGGYTSNTGNGYYGAYQFDRQTWGNYGGYAVASDAPPAVQDEKAWLTYQRRGWQPWPSCKNKMGLQDIYR